MFRRFQGCPVGPNRRVIILLHTPTDHRVLGADSEFDIHPIGLEYTTYLPHIVEILLTSPQVTKELS